MCAHANCQHIAYQPHACTIMVCSAVVVFVPLACCWYAGVVSAASHVIWQASLLLNVLQLQHACIHACVHSGTHDTAALLIAHCLSTACCLCPCSLRGLWPVSHVHVPEALVPHSSSSGSSGDGSSGGPSSPSPAARLLSPGLQDICSSGGEQQPAQLGQQPVDYKVTELPSAQTSYHSTTGGGGGGYDGQTCCNAPQGPLVLPAAEVSQTAAALPADMLAQLVRQAACCQVRWAPDDPQWLAWHPSSQTT
jgi:hypothetical protein